MHRLQEDIHHFRKEKFILPWNKALGFTRQSAAFQKSSQHWKRTIWNSGAHDRRKILFHQRGSSVKQATDSRILITSHQGAPETHTVPSLPYGLQVQSSKARCLANSWVPFANSTVPSNRVRSLTHLSLPALGSPLFLVRLSNRDPLTRDMKVELSTPSPWVHHEPLLQPNDRSRLASLLFLQAVHVLFLFPSALLGRDLQETGNSIYGKYTACHQKY